MNATSTTNDGSHTYRVPTLDYFTFIKLSYSSCAKLFQRFDSNYRQNYSFPKSFINDVRTYCEILPLDLFLVFSLAVFWTFFRIYLTSRVFLPTAAKLGISLQNRKKVPESCWKLLFYSFAWAWSAYIILLSGKYKYFWDPLSVWDDWHFLMPVPWDIQVAYLIQSSFYLHSIYGTIFLDVWRKDSIMMIFHHVLTIVLIGFSYASRYHAIGALVLFLHDISDVALELTKVNVYLKHRHGKFRLEHDLLSAAGFFSFAISWYVFRLYWFPLKVLYAALYGAAMVGPPDSPFVPLFNGMLWILLAMNCYWFSFILIFLVKVATGKAKEIEDTREYDDEETTTENNSEKSLRNGSQFEPVKDNVANGILHEKNDYVASRPKSE